MHVGVEAYDRFDIEKEVNIFPQIELHSNHVPHNKNVAVLC